jgi:hypothetical protein
MKEPPELMCAKSVCNLSRLWNTSCYSLTPKSFPDVDQELFANLFDLKSFLENYQINSSSGLIKLAPQARF